MSDEDMIRREDVLAEVAKMWKWSVLAAEELEEAVKQIPSVQPSPDVAALVAVKPLDLSYVQKHAFLAGVVAARNIPPSQPCSGPLLWLDYDPGDNPALSRIRSALAAQPSPAVPVALMALLAEARTDLAAYVDAEWPKHQRSFFPVVQEKWERDMVLCWKIDAALARVKGGEA